MYHKVQVAEALANKCVEALDTIEASRIRLLGGENNQTIVEINIGTTASANKAMKGSIHSVY